MKGRKTSPLLVAFVTVAIDLLGFGIVLPLLPLYAEHLLGGIPTAYHGLTIGLVMASFSFMQFLFMPGWGRLSDRIGRRPVLIIGLSGSVVFYALFGLASVQKSLVLLFISRIGAGIAGATIGTAQAVIADSTPPERRAKGMALIGMAFGVGFTLGPIIGSLWADKHGTELSPLPGFVASGLSLAALVLAVVRLPETRPVGVELPRRPWFNVEGWALALGNRGVAVPLLTFFVATLAFASFEGTLARFAKDELRFSLREMCYLFAYVGFVLMLTQGLIVRRLVTKVGEVAMTIMGTLLMLAGLVVVALFMSPDSLVFILATLALTVIGFAFLTPSVQALISRRSSALRQGEVLGVNQAAAAVARILGPVLGNVLYGSAASPDHGRPYYAGAGLLAVALALALTLRPDKADVPRPAPAG
jgi:MFS family permease